MPASASADPMHVAEQVLRAHPWIADVHRRPAGGLRIRPDPGALACTGAPGALVAEYLDHWSEVYDWTYASGRGQHAPDLDLSGWRATDTGGPFATGHMVEWVQRTVELVRATNPRRVLEVGTGTGMLLHRLVPYLTGYVGLDPSEVAVDTLRTANLPRATVVHAAAHELDTPRVRAALHALGAAPDCVVLNSVTQCFPSVEYLTHVLHRAIDLVAPGGTVVIGDIRHAGLLDAYCRWAEQATDPEVTEPELTARAERRAEREEELLVDPATLATIAAGATRPAHIALHAKTMRADTELTRYRFDAVVHTDLSSGQQPPRCVPWSQLPATDRLRALGQMARAANPDTPIRVTVIRNRLLASGTRAGAVSPAELHAAIGAAGTVLLDPYDPTVLQVAAPAMAAPVPAAQLAGPGRPHEPLPMFARRRLLEAARRTLRRAGDAVAAVPVTVDMTPAAARSDRPAAHPHASAGTSSAVAVASDRAGRQAIAATDTAALPAAMRLMDHVALLAMASTLREHGGFGDGTGHTADQLVAALGVAPRHAWIVRRWLAALTDEGWVQRDASGRYHGLKAVSPAQAAAATPDLDEARTTLGYPPDLTRFFRDAMTYLPDLLRDEVALQALLFPDGEVTTALGTYQDNVINRYLNAAAATVLRRFADERPTPLRVLELGAGVGGTTATVLDALAGHGIAYRFTDVSRFFLDGARERFGDHPQLRYALVDINRDLPRQGVPRASADVVLAANVLHNAHHVRRVLRGLHDVLADGGRLVVIESCREHYQAMTSMQFLMSPRQGQPRAGQDDVRAGTDRIFLTRAEWLAELQGAGLATLFDLPDPTDPLAALAQHLFVAAPERSDRRNQ